MSRDTFKKHLPESCFTHYQSRDEVRLLDYTPCINRKACTAQTVHSLQQLLCAAQLARRAVTDGWGCVHAAGRPVDLNTPLRTRRMGREIKMVLCITMYNVRDGAHVSLHSAASAPWRPAGRARAVVMECWRRCV